MFEQIPRNKMTKSFHFVVLRSKFTQHFPDIDFSTALSAARDQFRWIFVGQIIITVQLRELLIN